jgi:hypothetical protein
MFPVVVAGVAEIKKIGRELSNSGILRQTPVSR